TMKLICAISGFVCVMIMGCYSKCVFSLWLFFLHVSAYLAIGLSLAALAAKHYYVPKQFILTAAFGVIALFYYLVFFLSLLNPSVGKWFNFLIYLAGWSLVLFGIYKIKQLLKS